MKKILVSIVFIVLAFSCSTGKTFDIRKFETYNFEKLETKMDFEKINIDYDVINTDASFINEKNIKEQIGYSFSASFFNIPGKSSLVYSDGIISNMIFYVQENDKSLEPDLIRSSILKKSGKIDEKLIKMYGGESGSTESTYEHLEWNNVNWNGHNADIFNSFLSTYSSDGFALMGYSVKFKN